MTAASDKPASDQHYATEIKADRLQLLYEQSMQGVYYSLIGAGLLAAILWTHTPPETLLVWLLCLSLASLLRVLLFFAYRRAAPQGVDILRWSRPYTLTLFLSAAIWGLGSVVLVPSDSLLHAAIIYYFLMGMSGAGMSAYSAVRSLVIGTVVVMLLPMTVWMLFQGQLTPVLMAVGAVLLFLSALRTSKVLADMLQQNYRLTHELHASKLAAEQLARTDALTGLNNRRAFTELSERAIHLCQRQLRPYAAIVLDLDRFKVINDTRGHAIGDRALQHVAQQLQESVRKTDIYARTGGEEFAVLLPDAAEEDAMLVAEKIRATIAEHPVPTEDGPLPITASLGVACDPVELGSLIRLADMAMYRAKQDGRDRVVCHRIEDCESDQLNSVRGSEG